jgi:hypothetical protein
MRAKDDAPSTANTINGAARLRACGVKVKARKLAPMIGVSSLMVKRKAWVRSRTAEIMAAVISPTRMSSPPAIPASVSV